MANRNLIFSYDSQRTVMTYLDPLVRLRISTHCPSLHNLNSIVPLKIEYFRITRSDFEINDTTYKIGIIKQYLYRKNPTIVEEENAQGGRQFDTDQYGIERNQRMSGSIKRLEREMKKDQKRNKRSTWNEISRFEQTEVKLDILRAKRSNVHPPFSMYVQLMMIPDDGLQKVQYLVYNKTLQEVKDHFMLKLLGTDTPIHVKDMNVVGGYLLYPVEYYAFADEA